MSGHSRWANIKHRKAASDAKKGKTFTRLIKEVTVAARMGGADPAMNPRLRLAIDKAYDANMPKDTIERAAKRGTDGSVAFLFKHCGQFVFAPGTSEEKVLEAALDAGAEDVSANDDGSVEVVSSPAHFAAVRNGLAKAGLKPDLAEITMKPTLENALKGDEAGRMQRLLEALENIDDVQEVYTTAVIDQ